MKRFSLVVVMVALVAMTGLSTTVSGAPRKGDQARLEMYRATVDAATLQELVDSGYDITPVDETRDGVEIAIVVSTAERNQLRDRGVDLEVWRDRQGRTQSQRFALQAADGFEAFRPYDGEGGIEDELREIARRNRHITKLVSLGTTYQGRDILALRMTQGSRGDHRGRGKHNDDRPAVLYQGTTHAREWISTEVTRRLMLWYLDAWKSDKDVKRLLQKTELWFVPVVNPDGYQYTFDSERLWRKNLRDNNSNGSVDGSDGVDINRNYPEHWNYDDEGSSSEFTSETYRGPSPGSEPESQASIELFDDVDFDFAISYHSFGQLLLYAQGWQVQTPSADDPIYVALTGTDEEPAVEGFDPDVGAELYTTNGEFTDWAHSERDALAWTPELSEGCDGCGFVFPDDEALVQEEFEKNLDFALRVAQSAQDPDDPVSHNDVDTEDFYLDVSTIDPYKSNNPLSDLTFDVSYAGDSDQAVEVLAKRDLDSVKLHYRIDGGRRQTVRTSESPDGEVYGGNNGYNTHYEYLRGTIRRLDAGDEVEYWFSGEEDDDDDDGDDDRGRRGNRGGGDDDDESVSESAIFEVVEEDDADVLILAAEDRTGASNSPPYASVTPDAPNYLSYYEEALEANGVEYDVYDVDGRGRTAPDHLGVLSHYDAVVWYTGNDFVTRALDRGPGNVARLANDMTLEARQYLNEGGKLLYTGQRAGAVENGLAGDQFFDPVADESCVVGGELVLERCQLLSDKDDFLQYYLGAFIYNSGAGMDGTEPVPVDGVSDPYEEASWEFNGADSAGNQQTNASFLTTSSLLPADQYPQFASEAPAIYRGAGGSFEPFEGDHYMYSQRGDVSYKRIMRTIDLTDVSEADAPTLSFRSSYETEPAWDFVFVEAHTVGQDDWTTLPDLNGHTTQDTGDSCEGGWFELHPWLERYQGTDCSGSNPTTGGEWNAHSGRSEGWEEWSVDLSDYAGSEVELSLSYASDWAVQGLGSFVDAIEVSTGEGSTGFEEDDDPMDGWTVPGSPEGSATNPNDWIRTPSVGYLEGAVTSTDDTLYFGFGFEGISGAESRAAVMDRSIDYLLDD